MVSWSHRGTRTAALSAGLTALALVATAAVAPHALADPVADLHDFADGPQGWFSYGGSSSSTLAEGELCVVVPAGTTNAWDVAAQHDGVTFEEGGTYTVSFSAHATEAVTVPLRAGVGWPDDVSASVALTPDAQDYSFAWTPAFSGTGNVSFQLGAQNIDYTFCLDDFAISGDVELVATSFDGVLPDGWSANGWTVTSTAGEGEPLCFAVPADSDQYAGLVLNGLPIDEGANYRLDFTASSSNAATIRTIVGENAEPWRTAFVDNTALDTGLTRHTLAFTSPVTFPARSDDPAVGVGQVALQMGARGDQTFCITTLSLTKAATPPPSYEPDVRGPVRVNQVGYLPDGPKNATVVNAEPQALAWQLEDAAGTVVASGHAGPTGVDASSGLAVQTVDFSTFRTPGVGYTLVVGDDRSDPFAISSDVYAQLRYDALNYFYPVRSGIAVDVPDDRYDRPAGHVSGPDGAVNKGDLDVACLTAAEDGAAWSYGTWTCPAGYARDVVGGWYDAGDHGKYVVNGGIAVAQLMSLYERTLHTPNAVRGALGDGTLDVPADENGNKVPDVLDEARWELEFLLAMQVPARSGMTVSATDRRSLDGMVHHKIHDVGWTGLGLLPSQDAQQRRLHRPSTAATLNLAATAAQGARLFDRYDKKFAERLLQASRTAYAAAARVPDLYAPASAGQNGGGPYDDTQVADERYWAAAELFLTTGEKRFAQDVERSPLATADIWSRSGFSWGSVAALGRLDLATVPSRLASRDAVRASVVAGAQKYLGWQQAEAFGTAYPGEADGSYVWGSSSSVLNNQVVLATAYDVSGDARFARAVLESMDYLLGRNAMNVSYVTGYGTQYASHQHSRWLVPPPPGTVSGGPNSQRGTWDPVMNRLYPAGHDCAPQLCYVDDVEAWSVNELTINWNAPLAWIASFAADLGALGLPSAPVVTVNPADVSARTGTAVVLHAAAVGTPTPTIQWQVRSSDGRGGSGDEPCTKGKRGPGDRSGPRGRDGWVDVPGPKGREGDLRIVVTAATDGDEYRAVFRNASGSATSSSAHVTEVRRHP